MNGKIVAAGIAGIALAGGALMYWLQVYAYYDEVAFGPDDIRLTAQATEQPEPIAVDDAQGIDADSSPLRFRACFTTTASLGDLTATYVRYDDPVPLNAPHWFSCFDAEAIAEGLADGRAVALLGESNYAYGVDRVVAVFDDGRAFAWHQLNNCGETAYDGTPVGEECPPREE